MKPRPDPHRVLGLPRGASAAEVTRAFRRLAREFHPDVATGTDAATRFATGCEAYRQLMSETLPPAPQTRGTPIPVRRLPAAPTSGGGQGPPLVAGPVWISSTGRGGDDA